MHANRVCAVLIDTAGMIHTQLNQHDVKYQLLSCTGHTSGTQWPLVLIATLWTVQKISNGRHYAEVSPLTNTVTMLPLVHGRKAN